MMSGNPFIWLLCGEIFWSILLMNTMANGTIYRKEPVNEEDKTVKSDNYPEPYPPNLNYTWLCESTASKWAVFFLDFELDSPAIGSRDSDWLELDDGVKPLRYTSSSPPKVAYHSSGHYLRMTFISDQKTDKKSRGFKSKILHGKDDKEIYLKIHALKSQKSKSKDDDEKDGNNWLLITIVVCAVTFLISIIAVAFLCFIYRRKMRRSESLDRNAYGVRRDSGIFHSRNPREQHTNEVLIVTRQTRSVSQDSRDQSQDQQRRRPSQPKRSNSQKDWVARAEFSTAVPPTSQQSSRPNMNTRKMSQPQSPCGGRNPDDMVPNNSRDCEKEPSSEKRRQNCNENLVAPVRKNNLYHNFTKNSDTANTACTPTTTTFNTDTKFDFNRSSDSSKLSLSNGACSNDVTPSSPIYCNSDVDSPKSLGPSEGLLVNVKFGHFDTTSPSTVCSQKVSSCQNPRIDYGGGGGVSPTTITVSCRNKPDDARDTSTWQKTPQRSQEEEEDDTFSEKVKGKGEFKPSKHEELDRILEGNQNRQSIPNPYTNWDLVRLGNKESHQRGDPARKISASASYQIDHSEGAIANADVSSSFSSDTSTTDCGDYHLVPMSDSYKCKERSNKEENAWQLSTAVPAVASLPSPTTSPSNCMDYQLSFNVPNAKNYLSAHDSNNHGEYHLIPSSRENLEKYGTESSDAYINISHLSEKVPKTHDISSSQNGSFVDSGEYHLIPSANEYKSEQKRKTSVGTNAHHFDSTVYVTSTTFPERDISFNDCGDYHLVPIHNRHDSETRGEIEESSDKYDYQLNLKVPKASNSLSSQYNTGVNNSGEYHLLPGTSRHNSIPEDEEYLNAEDYQLNVNVPAPCKSLPLRKVSFNDSGEYHLVPSSDRQRSLDRNEEEEELAETDAHKLNWKIPAANTTLLSQEGEYHLIPSASGGKPKPTLETKKNCNEFANQLSAKVPKASGVCSSQDGEYHLIPTANQGRSEERRDKEKDLYRNVNLLSAKVPTSNIASSPLKEGEYHMLSNMTGYRPDQRCEEEGGSGAEGSQMPARLPMPNTLSDDGHGEDELIPGADTKEDV